LLTVNKIPKNAQKPKQTVTIYRTQTVTTVMVTSRLRYD